MSTKKTTETSTISISPQILNRYDHLKHVLAQVTGRDDLTDDEVVAAYWWIYAFIYSRKTMTHSQSYTKWSCCGWWHCSSHTEEKKQKGECCGSC